MASHCNEELKAIRTFMRTVRGRVMSLISELLDGIWSSMTGTKVSRKSDVSKNVAGRMGQRYSWNCSVQSFHIDYKLPRSKQHLQTSYRTISKILQSRHHLETC